MHMIINTIFFFIDLKYLLVDIGNNYKNILEGVNS
jgi:hypothetical protein